jgi:hypothetical protein
MLAGRRRCMTGTHRAQVVAAVCAAFLAASCTSDGSVESAPTEAPSSNTSIDNAPSNTTSRSASSGKPFDLYTHCGVENARIRGVWWHADPPLYNERRNGPPAGWGDPYQTGTLTMLSDSRAVFEALGQRVVLVPAPDNQPVRICD